MFQTKVKGKSMLLTLRNFTKWNALGRQSASVLVLGKSIPRCQEK
jgi:hypothetical protein